MLARFIFTIVLLSGCSSMQIAKHATYEYSEKDSYKVLKSNASRIGRTDHGRAYGFLMIERHNQYWEKIATKCGKEPVSIGLYKFNYIIVINENGKVLKIATDPNVIELECFRKSLSEINFPSHNMGAYYTSFKISNMEKWDL